MGRGVPYMTDPSVAQTLGMAKCSQILPNEEIKKQLRINDEQIHCNRFKWYNLPYGLTGNMIERILYYRGQAAIFFIPGANVPYFLPFCLNGGIDIYGRYTSVTPLPFNGSTEFKNINDARNSKDQLTKLLVNYKANVIYDPVDLETIKANPDMLRNSCVILSDYTRQLSQIVIPKYKLTESIIDYESKLIPYLNTALSNATGIGGVRVEDQAEQAVVEEASQSAEFAALTGRKWIPVVGQLDIQELTGGQVAKAEEFLLTMQSLVNYRLSIHGIENNGMYQKKAHMLQTEADMNLGTYGYVMKDALYNRQQWCTIVNSLWGTEIWVEPDEITVGVDYNMDGIVGGGMDGQMIENNGNNQQEVTEE